MDIGQELIKTVKKLRGKKIESAEFEADVLLSFVLRKSREYLLTYPEKKISFWQKFIFNSLINKRLAGHPLAYLTGHKEFYGLDFLVNKNVLVPRPETELMVDEVLEIISNIKYPILNIIDAGTGSGCVIISLAKILDKNNINFYGLDISRQTLTVAKKNAVKNGVADCIHFLYSNLLNNIDKDIFKQPTIITANLPYLTSKQVKNSPTIQKEPRIALLSGSDGLNHYRLLFAQIKEIYQSAADMALFLLCEIDETQESVMKELIGQELPAAEFEIKKDLNGDPRLVVITL